MSDFKAKMHQIRFRLGLRPTASWGNLQRSPDFLAGFTCKGAASRQGGEGKGWGNGRGMFREEKRGGGKEEKENGWRREGERWQREWEDGATGPGMGCDGEGKENEEWEGKGDRHCFNGCCLLQLIWHVSPTICRVLEVFVRASITPGCVTEMRIVVTTVTKQRKSARTTVGQNFLYTITPCSADLLVARLDSFRP